MSGDLAESGQPAGAAEPADDSADADAGTGARSDAAELRARIELLEEENAALRAEYARARQQRYRRTALGMVGLGIVAALGGLLFPDARTVLFALAGTGLLLGVLTFYLAPERFLGASVGEAVYDALAANESAAVAELGLRERRVYVPTERGVRLFVPQHADHEIPDGDALEGVFVVTDDEASRGLALEPTGATLAAEFERAVTGDVGDDAATIGRQVADALVEQFELVDGADVDAGPESRRVTLAVSGSAVGAVDRFDHPVASLLATVLAQGLDEAVVAEAEEVTEGAAEYRVTATVQSGNGDGEESD